MYTVITSPRSLEDLSIGFTRDFINRPKKCNANKENHGKFHVWIWMNDLSGFAEQVQRAALGFCWNLLFKRHIGNTSSSGNAGAVVGKNDIQEVTQYVLQYTPSLTQQNFLNPQLITKTPIERTYIKRSVYSKNVNQQNRKEVDLGVGEERDLLIFVIVVIQQKHRFNIELMKNDCFFWQPVKIAQCFFGTEIRPDASVYRNYAHYKNI